ncbi:hypothetical protein DFA_08512 [Cavenderia fasciculata]|uniref:Uncharacterized protein n=1 Tax=Cavenderia fasciculata TaxID=261658 RepID=F4Q2P9_CACFS|nr:uncharacterized protein DFA_08512 [Cavenderia fasciculata]EGG17516.1 hypothetical protein DFA_08512 [Cavenderia fasciculata]|eukprot:XP_004356000.1 hypothetical protein DFA_08512 [Cavenderia fasciculata]
MFMTLQTEAVPGAGRLITIRTVKLETSHEYQADLDDRVMRTDTRNFWKRMQSNDSDILESIVSDPSVIAMIDKVAVFYPPILENTEDPDEYHAVVFNTLEDLFVEWVREAIRPQFTYSIDAVIANY